MYNLVLSLFFKIGIKSENHVISSYLLKKIFSFENSLINEAKTERVDKQYYVGFKISKQEVEDSLIKAEEFNRELKGFILSLGKKDVPVYRNKFQELIKECWR
jgi:uncharacterized protein (UPF0332 family)